MNCWPGLVSVMRKGPGLISGGTVLVWSCLELETLCSCVGGPVTIMPGYPVEDVVLVKLVLFTLSELCELISTGRGG